MLSQGLRDLRKKLSGFAAALVVPAALLLAPGVAADPHPAEQPGAPVVDAAPVSDAAQALDALHAHGPAPEAAPGPAPEAAPVPAPEAAPAPEVGIVVPAAHVDLNPRLLPPGVVAEEGLQVATIRIERNICAKFPQIRNIIGVRPDPKPWHPSGRAIDIMIPDAGSEAGIALGDAIRDYALTNAEKFGVQDVIWRGTYHTPAGPGGSGYGHYDHVHITTFGGGYPTGSEAYFAED